MRFAVLGSGSGGNSAVVEFDDQYVLIDVGLSAKQIILRLEELNVAPEKLLGIVLTHEHGDHTRGLEVFKRKHDVPVYANALTQEFLSRKMERVKGWQVFERLNTFQIGPFHFQAFPVQHDAVDPMGFSVEADECKLGFLSDVGFITNLVKAQLQECDLLAIEANYDLELLDLDEKRPWSTKQRISSRHGHLSNNQVAEFLQEVACERLQRIVLGHLSSDCNCSVRATEVIQTALEVRDLRNVHVVCAEQHSVSEWYSLKKETPTYRPGEHWESLKCGKEQGKLFDF